MRIKKKHVLLESLLIDVTTEFTPVEKKIFKMLNKHYGNPIKGEEGKKRIYSMGGRCLVDRNFRFIISKTHIVYLKHIFGVMIILFSEAPTLRKKVSLPYLFFEHFRDLQDKS